MNPLLRLPVVVAIVATAGTLCTQCPSPSTWIPGGTCPAPDGTVWAMVRWDPDGAGPLGVHVVCGGEFRYAGASATANVALYDPVTRSWSPLGAGLDAPVRALTVTVNGELVAGGAFLQSGGRQVAPVELGAGGAITGVTSSNALTLTIGAL